MLAPGDLPFLIAREIGFSLAVAILGALLALLLVGFVWLCVAVSGRRDWVATFQRQALAAFAIAAPMSIIAIVTGVLTGLSRDPAVTATIPAVLTLVGGGAALVMQRNRATLVPVGIAICAFSTALLVGALLGTDMRAAAEDAAAAAEIDAKFARLEREAELERQLRNYRGNLGLPEMPEPPPSRQP